MKARPAATSGVCQRWAARRRISRRTDRVHRRGWPGCPREEFCLPRMFAAVPPSRRSILRRERQKHSGRRRSDRRRRCDIESFAHSRRHGLRRHSVSWLRPPEVWSGRIGAWQQRTHQRRAQTTLGSLESVEWTNDGYLQGWLLYPRDFDPTKRYPMIVGIHGGPAAR